MFTQITGNIILELTIRHALNRVRLGHAQKCIATFFNEVVVLLSTKSLLALQFVSV